MVVGTLTGYGGIEVCVRSLARDAAANGDTVRVLALCPSLNDGGWHEGLAYSEVSHGSSSLKKQIVQGLPAFVRACKEHPPDAVIVIYSATLLMVRLGLLLAGLRRPVLAWLHFSLAYRQRTSLLRLADAHLCISAEIAQATKRLPGVRSDGVHLVYNGTPMEAVRAMPRSTSGPLRVLHVGRLMQGSQKRTDDLLLALAQVHGDWHLDLLGPACPESDFDELRTLAEHLCIADRVTFHGRKTPPWEAVKAADVLVLCSAFEGFPLVLIEAMARGIPCLSSDCPSGPSDVIRPEENGWLFEVSDVAALAARLQTLVDSREALPSAEAVRASVREFSSSKVFQRIRRAIEETVAA
ncbi:MAG: glycosyltransferase [Variovorax sp.]|nr:glycosyltransferase [Variovorax sp.]